MSAVAIGGVAAKGGHLDVAAPPVPDHRRHAEGGADGQGAAAAEQFADLIGRGVAGHVVVLGRAAKELIADTAAGPIGLEAGPPQPADHLHGETALFIGHKRRHGHAL